MMADILAMDTLNPLAFEDVRDFPPSVMEKVAKMKEKTDFVIGSFNLPHSETVIQDYRCSINTGDQEASGKLFITQNYFLFASKDNQILESFAFTRIESMIKEKSMVFFNDTIKIEMDSGTVSFSGLIHRDETFNLLRHLWTFQPTYIHLSEEEMLSQIKDAFNVDEEVTQRVQKKLADSKSGEKPKEFSGRWGQLEGEIKDIEEHEVPDIDLGKDAQRKAYEIQQLRLATLQKIQGQAESLDRTERVLQETSNNLNHANRKLDGMESGFGEVKNIFTPNLHKNKMGAFEQTDRTVTIDNEKCTDIPILIKQPNDFLEPGLIRFGENRFRCLDGDRNEIKKYSYPYPEVYQVVIRARHQHLDIKFKHTKDRFRCCTSFIQAVVNEIFLRTKSGQVTLVHEPETRRFQYGNLAIRELTLQGNRDEGSEIQSDSSFTPKARYSTLLSDAPGVIQEAQQVQDAQINDLSGVVSDIQSINQAMDAELHRQVNQIEDIHKLTDKNLQKANQTTYRTTRLK